MGSFNRDYMQDEYDTRSGPTWGHDVPTTKWLIIVTVGIYCLQVLFSSTNGVSAIDVWLPLDASAVRHGQIWRVVTYPFCHVVMNPIAIVFNMLLLWYFGSTLERMYGSREILWFYLGSAVATALVFLSFGLKLQLAMPYSGAGPCVAALFMLFATHFPRQEIYLFGIVPIQVRILLGIYIILDILVIVNATKGMNSWEGVPYLMNLWAVGLAYLYRRADFRFTTIGEYFDFGNVRRAFRRMTTSRKLKVFAPDPSANLDEQVDAILAKIHDSGSESLTERERAVLQQASDRAKNRQ